MKCPRCSGNITDGPDDAGFIVCPACGAKLRSKTQAVFKAQRPIVSPARSAATDGTDIDSVLARLEAPASSPAAARPPANPNATLPPGTPLPKIPRPVEARPAVAPTPPPSLEMVLAEIRALRRTQEEILEILQSRPSQSEFGMGNEANDPFGGLLGEGVPAVPAVRTGRRKTVLLIDDDEDSRQEAMAALEQADVPVQTAVDGNGGLAAIAMEKPDIIVMELDLSGSMGGKDVINMIKATMEWVDIPILLYTRVPVASQKEARTVHGADELVLKGDGGPGALVAKVISLFRKG